jgi:uncharacterized protein YigA (DUF484 family)
MTDAKIDSGVKNKDVKTKDSKKDDAKIQLAIKKYLIKHPGYFANHPELMAELEVLSPQGELTNLVTHQLRTLQNENRQLKAQISQLIKNAQQSESMMNRLFSLLTELSVVKKADFLQQFVSFVTENFPTDYFKLLVTEGLIELPENDHIESLNAAQLNHFAVFQAKPEPLSGRLKQDKILSIFTDSTDIKSAIVLPIGVKASFGLLAFASVDEEKFHPNSSSDLLQKLAQILAAYFLQQQPKDENQAMS